jgi:hypothetical protein
MKHFIPVVISGCDFKHLQSAATKLDPELVTTFEPALQTKLVKPN